MKKQRRTIINNTLALTLVFAVNALANILPINGLNTGQVSALYPSLFTPAGFTFSVWSVIYLLLIGFLVYQNKISQRIFFHSLSKWLLVSCVANASWILAWHYLFIEFSVLIMFVLLSSLAVIFLLLQKQKFNLLENLLIKLPFTFYFSWICVATIANISALLVHWQWSGGFLSAVDWTIVMISIAALLSIYIASRFFEPAFLVITLWAFFGIYSKWTDSANSSIAFSALLWIVVLIIAIVLIALRWILKYRKENI